MRMKIFSLFFFLMRTKSKGWIYTSNVPIIGKSKERKQIKSITI